MLVAVLALISLASAAPAQNAATCDTTKMATCGNAFLASLGITSKLSGTEFILYTQKLVADQGVQGIVKTCTASQALVQCLGDQADACFNLADMQKAFGISQEDSIVYTYQLKGMMYTCVENPAPFQAQIQCIAKTSHDDFSQLSACTSTLFSSMGKDPSNICKYLKQYMTCSVPYYGACGADVQTALCKGMTEQAAAIMPGCTWSCSSATSYKLFLKNDACDTSLLANCAASYGAALGVSGLPSGTDFVKFIYDLVASKGVAGIQQTCAATVGLNTCLGAAADVCFNAESLVQALGLTAEDAIEYIFQIQGMEYSCVQNPAPFVAQIQCIADTSKNSYVSLLKCADTLHASVSNDPANACTALGAFKDCTTPFYAACGSALQGALCQGIASQAKAVLPTCSVTC